MFKRGDMMEILKIKRAIESQLTEVASDYWHNTDYQNDYIIIAQREGIDAAVTAIEEMAAD